MAETSEFKNPVVGKVPLDGQLALLLLRLQNNGKQSSGITEYKILFRSESKAEVPLAFCFCAKQHNRKPYMEWRFSQYSSLLGEIKYSITLQFLLSPHQAVRWSIFSKFRNFMCFFSPHHLSPQLDVAKCNTSAKHVELQFQGDLESKGLETWLNILHCICCRPFKQLVCV